MNSSSASSRNRTRSSHVSASSSVSGSTATGAKSQHPEHVVHRTVLDVVAQRASRSAPDSRTTPAAGRDRLSRTRPVQTLCAVAAAAAMTRSESTGDARRVTGQHQHEIGSGSVGRRHSTRPAAIAATGPPPGGCSRVHGNASTVRSRSRRGGVGGTDDHHRVGTHRVQGGAGHVDQQRTVGHEQQRLGGPRQPAGRTTGQDDRRQCHRPSIAAGRRP